MVNGHQEGKGKVGNCCEAKKEMGGNVNTEGKTKIKKR